MFMTAFITAVAAYLIGSVSFAVIFTKTFVHKDIRELGSGNAGSTNVIRAGGFPLGALTFVCDALKGFLASGLGYLIFSYIYNTTANTMYHPIYGAFICGLFCIIGHVFPLFFGFRGGKGVAVSVGIVAVCSPFSILIGLGVFVLVLVFSKYVSLSSLSAGLVTAIFVAVFSVRNDAISPLPQIILILLMYLIIVLKHLDNIKRLISGEENKIGGR